MKNTAQMLNANFDQFHFSVATPADNLKLIGLLRKNPIQMEMDYVMDKREDFFKIHHYDPDDHR